MSLTEVEIISSDVLTCLEYRPGVRISYIYHKFCFFEIWFDPKWRQRIWIINHHNRSLELVTLSALIGKEMLTEVAGVTTH